MASKKFLFVVLALTFVVFTGCPNLTGGGGGGGGGGGEGTGGGSGEGAGGVSLAGSRIKVTNADVYDFDNMTLISDTAYDGTFKTIGNMSGDFSTSSYTATIRNGKLNIDIGAPNNDELTLLKNLEVGSYVTGSNAQTVKGVILYQYFVNEDYLIYLMRDSDINSFVGFIYVDKSVTLNGNNSNYSVNVSLQPGWNMMEVIFNDDGTYTTTNVSSNDPYIWVIVSNSGTGG
jgi:hypothetical protein